MDANRADLPDMPVSTSEIPKRSIVRAMATARKTAAAPARKAKPGKPAKPNGNGHKKPAKVAKARSDRKAADVAQADPTLFSPLTPGEVADALRTLTEDRRL